MATDGKVRKNGKVEVEFTVEGYQYRGTIYHKKQRKEFPPDEARYIVLAVNKARFTEPVVTQPVPETEPEPEPKAEKPADGSRAPGSNRKEG